MKRNGVKLTSFRNDEHFEFFTHFLNLVNRFGAATLKIAASTSSALRRASFERHLASKELLVLSGEHTGSPLRDGMTIHNIICMDNNGVIARSVTTKQSMNTQLNAGLLHPAGSQ